MNRYHLLVIGGTTDIGHYVNADGYWTERRAYWFFNYEDEKKGIRTVQCVYPINLTIIKSIEILEK
jgi:hypothetical protein